MSRDVFWDRLPRDLIAEAWSAKWSRDNPAPKAVGYMLAYSIAREGGSWSVRDIAEHCGWSRSMAHKVAKRVRADFAADTHADTDETKTDTHADTRRSKNADNLGVYKTKTDTHADTRETKTDAHVRAFLSQEKESEERDNKQASDAALLSELWDELVAFTPKPGAWKLNPKRKKALRARLREHDEETIRRVATWVRTSKHERAAFLRERGDAKTIIRADNFDTYAALSLQPDSMAPSRPAPLPFDPANPPTDRDWTPQELDLYTDHLRRVDAENDRRRAAK